MLVAFGDRRHCTPEVFANWRRVPINVRAPWWTRAGAPSSISLKRSARARALETAACSHLETPTDNTGNCGRAISERLCGGSRLWCARGDQGGTVCALVGHFAFSGRLSSGRHTSLVERIVPMPAYDPLHLLRKLLRLRCRRHNRNRFNRLNFRSRVVRV
jgi:hypothetical protein